ncbi:hypothetical protein QAD02_005165 [Eretmocerus hayati]|uniref:Uncharacterized protein n=1 Tax=Eretmocerus hayati TaxID=131215 RepID=A0ACC2NSR6_9HYME|nr:hypothetical protein QAD02_005165 [Eretmocerus hayati]
MFHILLLAAILGIGFCHTSPLTGDLKANTDTVGQIDAFSNVRFVGPAHGQRSKRSLQLVNELIDHTVDRIVDQMWKQTNEKIEDMLRPLKYILPVSGPSPVQSSGLVRSQSEKPTFSPPPGPVYPVQ